MAGTSSVYGGSGPAGEISFNYIPLIDVTFNLILFFVLTSTINTAAMARVVLPRPEASMAVDRSQIPANSVIVNVISSAPDQKNTSLLSATAKHYEIDCEPIRVGDKEKLVQRMKIKREQQERLLVGNPQDFYVEIRADYRVNYADIEPILMAAAEAKIPKMNITAIVEAGR
jgi:biopolymer transport protein ExbD